MLTKSERTLSLNSCSTMLSIVALLVTASIASGSSANAANFSFTQIDVPGAFDIEAASDINDAGQIVGWFDDSTRTRHGFLYNGGSFTTLDVPGASSTAATGINNLGQIVGDFGTMDGLVHGFLRDPSGSFVTVDRPGFAENSPKDLNDTGQIVGGFGGPGPEQGYFRDTDGSFTTIEVPGAFQTFPFSINNSGQISGSADSGFTYSGGSFTMIDVPGALATQASRNNDLGQIVGWFTTDPRLNEFHGFLDSGGSFTTINPPGSSDFTEALGINNIGQIVGLYRDNQGVQRGFLATPVLPTPVFAGNPLAANCYGQSTSALARQYRGLSAAAKALGYNSLGELQNAIRDYCNPNQPTVGSVALISNTQFEAVSPLWSSDFAGEIAAVDIPEPSSISVFIISLIIFLGVSTWSIRHPRY